MTNQVTDISFTLNPEAVASIHDHGIVILHTGKGSLFSSNQTGARVWRSVEQRLPVEVLIKEISGEYQISQTAAREHIVLFLTELERHALIQKGAAL